jgi:hypothetical protein
MVLEIREWVRLGTDDFPAEWREIGKKASVLARSEGGSRRDCLRLRPLKVGVLAMRAKLSEIPLASMCSRGCRMVLGCSLIGRGPYPGQTSGILEGGSKEQRVRVPPQVGR